MPRFTLQHLQQLKDEGKIVDWKDNTKTAATSPSVPKAAVKKRSKEKDWLSFNLAYWANEQGLELIPEFIFHPQRKWRFDWAFPAIKVACEYEGIFSQKSRHTTISGYTGDIAKYNAANALGWRIIRLTAKDYKTVLQQLKQYL